MASRRPMADRIRVLIADDEPLARRRLRTLLAAHPDLELVGECCDGPDTLRALESQRPDLLLLDVQMPELTGVELMRRAEALPPALVFVTAYDEERFGLMLRRVRALLEQRRSHDAHEKLLAFVESLGVPADAGLPVLRVADIEIDRAARRARRGGKLVVLRRREFDVLVRLLERAGNVVTRKELLHDVWGYQDDVVSRTVDTHIFELRRKFGHEPGEAGYIETVSRVGYRLLPEAVTTPASALRSSATAQR